jgi:sarcosine oxidase subunit gamma
VTVDQQRHSPLAGWSPGGLRGVAMRELAFLTAVNLRVDPAGAAARRIGELLGAALPTEPTTVAAAGRRFVLWLGPDEWLVLGPDQPVAALVESLRGPLAGGPGSAVDVSAQRTTIELTGPRARAVLAKGCPLDLHPRAFQAGRCAQTLVGRAQVLVWQAGDEAYRLLVRASFAGYLAAWLADAADEYRDGAA